MKKLFNNDPGSLHDKFKDLESIPSMNTWQGMEQRLYELNRSIRKRRVRRAVLVSIPSAAVVFIVALLLSNENEPVYQPRGTYFADQPVDGEEYKLVYTDNDQGYLYDQVNTHDENLNSGNVLASNETTGNENAAEHPETTPDPKLDNAVLNASVNANKEPNISGHPLNSLHVNIKEINVSNQHPIGVQKKIPSLTNNSSKWRLEFHSGVDVTRFAKAPRITKSATAFATVSGTNNHVSWAFQSYEHMLPVHVYLGVQRKITRRISFTGGIDFRSLRARAESYPYKARYAVKTGSIRHAGINLGTRFELRRRGRIKPFIAGELNAAYVANSKVTITEYDDDVITSKETYETPNESNFINLVGVAGLDIGLTPVLDLQLSAVANKPLFNYYNDLNVYNNGEKYIYGGRIGLIYSY